MGRFRDQILLRDPEVSYLSINTTRERQYPSSTSGILFAKLVRASVDVFSITGNGPVQVGWDSTRSIAGIFGSGYRHEDQGLPPEPLANECVQV